jgi:hypothetical protein
METDTNQEQSPQTSYGEGEVKALEGLALIRRRPTLFIDGMDSDGLHRLVAEAVDNAVDEFSTGNGREVSVILHHDGSVATRLQSYSSPEYLQVRNSRGRPTARLEGFTE